MTITVAQMLAEARRAHEAHVAAADASARLVAILQAQLAAETGNRSLGIKAAARLTGVSVRTLRRRAEEGRIGRREGDVWRFAVEELKAFREAA